MRFIATQFTPTEWATATEKTAFANWLLEFITKGFPRSKFHKTRYRQLSNCFRHIAHFNAHGFYDTWFSSPARRVRFLENIASYGCHGAPDHTFCDVEKALQEWLRRSATLPAARKALAAETEARERSQLAHLKAKYPDG